MNLFKLFNKKIVISTILSCFFSFANCSAFNVTDTGGYLLYWCKDNVVEHYDRQELKAPILGTSVACVLEQIEDGISRITLKHNEKRYPFCLKRMTSKSVESDCGEFEFWKIEPEDKGCAINGVIKIQDFFTVVELSSEQGEKRFRYSDDANTLSLLIDGNWKIAMCSESKMNPFQIFSIVAHQTLRGEL